MAGRAAEVLVFNSVTSGAANDIENATKIARAMVTMYGMSDKFGMMCLATVQNQYLEGGAGLICGENTASQIDDEVLSIINSSYAEAMKLLDENREILDSISDYLYEKETITGKEFMKMFRDMKGLPTRTKKKMVKRAKSRKMHRMMHRKIRHQQQIHSFVTPQTNLQIQMNLPNIQHRMIHQIISTL